MHHFTCRYVNSFEDEKLIHWADAQCFPNDTPPVFKGANWWIFNDPKTFEIAGYCAWKIIVPWMCGFHYRAGVLHAYRGNGLQQQMLNLREEDMRLSRVKNAVTYTDADNAASMNSLINMGYKTYNPKHSAFPLLSGEGRLGRVGFVHWKKELK